MKAAVFMLSVVLLLSGCSNGASDLDRALVFRDRLLEASECRFHAVIVADYGDTVHTFEMDTKTDSQGDLFFEVIYPETISGISGTVRQEGPFITFDDKILAFPMLADGLLAPVAAPWVLMKALRSGYISSVVKEGEHWHITLRDSYEEDALTVDAWLDEQWTPVQCRIYYKEEDILTLQLEDFKIV